LVPDVRAVGLLVAEVEVAVRIEDDVVNGNSSLVDVGKIVVGV
jgi:hypothetical protein